MKKTNKIIVLICMVAVLAIALTGCEFGKKRINEREINKSQLENYTEYVHSTGIKFSYPSEWKNLSSSEEQPMFGNTSTGTSVNYLSESVTKISDIDAYMEAAITNVKEQMDIVGDIIEEKVKLNGKDASIITYVVNQSGTNVTIKQACFIEDGASHILTVASLESNFDEQAEILDNIISSFTK